MEALDTFIGSMLTLERWPFWAAVLVFTVIGQFTSKNLFTRERAYAAYAVPWHKHLWWWGRESLVLHPLLSGIVLGTIWQDPEGAGWKLVSSQMYFAAAGAVSLPFWVIVKALAKKSGMDLSLPGASSNPPPPPTE